MATTDKGTDSAIPWLCLGFGLQTFDSPVQCLNSRPLTQCCSLLYTSYIGQSKDNVVC